MVLFLSPCRVDGLVLGELGSLVAGELSLSDDSWVARALCTSAPVDSDLTPVCVDAADGETPIWENPS